MSHDEHERPTIVGEGRQQTVSGGPAVGAGTPDEYTELRAALLAEPTSPPVLEANGVERGTISLEELAAAAVVEVHETPPTVVSATGDTPLLTAKDVRLGRPPSRLGNADTPGAVLLRAGDLVAILGSEASVRVRGTDGGLLGPGVHLIRPDPGVVDPGFLAGVLRAALEGGVVDLYRVTVPRIPLAEQRAYAAVFEQLAEVEDESRRRRASVERMLRVGYRGLAEGWLRPGASAG